MCNSFYTLDYNNFNLSIGGVFTSFRVLSKLNSEFSNGHSVSCKELLITETTKRPRRTLLILLFLFFKTFTTNDNLITVNCIFYFRCSVQSEQTQQESKHNSFPLEFDKQFQSYLGLRTSGESCLCCNHICNAVA